MRKQKTVTVFDQAKYDGDWPPLNSYGFMAWFNEKIESIPPEYRVAAKIEIDHCEEYASIAIYYERPETDDEMTAREALKLKLKESTEVREIRELERLKAKYEPIPHVFGGLCSFRIKDGVSEVVWPSEFLNAAGKK